MYMAVSPLPQFNRGRGELAVREPTPDRISVVGCTRLHQGGGDGMTDNGDNNGITFLILL
jgi:hypothetical protein